VGEEKKEGTPGGRPESYAFYSERSNGPGMLLRVLTTRVPAWVTIVLVAAAAAGFGIVVATRTSVDLGPALNDAREATVSLTICNEIVDRRKINPRAAELAFESGLRQAGVEEPDVAIERIDCGPAVTAPAPAG